MSAVEQGKMSGYYTIKRWRETKEANWHRPKKGNSGDDA